MGGGGSGTSIAMESSGPYLVLLVFRKGLCIQCLAEPGKVLWGFLLDGKELILS